MPVVDLGIDLLARTGARAGFGRRSSAERGAAEALRPHLGARYERTQRFGDRELVVTPADERGIAPRFDIRPA